MESLLSVVLVLVVLGLLVWAIQVFLPIDSRIKTLIVVVIVIGAILYLFSAFFGISPSLR